MKTPFSQLIYSCLIVKVWMVLSLWELSPKTMPNKLYHKKVNSNIFFLNTLQHCIKWLIYLSTWFNNYNKVSKFLLAVSTVGNLVPDTQGLFAVPALLFCNKIVLNIFFKKLGMCKTIERWNYKSFRMTGGCSLCEEMKFGEQLWRYFIPHEFYTLF